jgi:hypothetical protein
MTYPNEDLKLFQLRDDEELKKDLLKAAMESDKAIRMLNKAMVTIVGQLNENDEIPQDFKNLVYFHLQCTQKVTQEYDKYKKIQSECIKTLLFQINTFLNRGSN